jgi:hypothetical protein
MKDIKLSVKGTVASRAEANGQLFSPGDAVLIDRGRPRWLLLRCPCGCGDELPINLDSRSGAAWRFYKTADNVVSLFPSVWRDTGCGSHFIVWRNHIVLFGDGDIGDPPEDSEELEGLVEAVRKQLSDKRLVSYVDIADTLGEVPWDILRACRYLVRQGTAREGRGKSRGFFGLASWS